MGFYNDQKAVQLLQHQKVAELQMNLRIGKLQGKT